MHDSFMCLWVYCISAHNLSFQNQNPLSLFDRNAQKIYESKKTKAIPHTYIKTSWPRTRVNNLTPLTKRKRLTPLYMILIPHLPLNSELSQSLWFQCKMPRYWSIILYQLEISWIKAILYDHHTTKFFFII